MPIFLLIIVIYDCLLLNATGNLMNRQKSAVSIRFWRLSAREVFTADAKLRRL
jgi:hypothetical protein